MCIHRDFYSLNYFFTPIPFLLKAALTVPIVAVVFGIGILRNPKAVIFCSVSIEIGITNPAIAISVSVDWNLDCFDYFDAATSLFFIAGIAVKLIAIKSRIGVSRGSPSDRANFVIVSVTSPAVSINMGI